MFPNFVNNDLDILGESYTGHYIPAFVCQFLSNTSYSYIKLKAVVLGDPWTHRLVQVPTESEYYYATEITNKKIRDYIQLIEATATQAILNQYYEYASNLAN